MESRFYDSEMPQILAVLLLLFYIYYSYSFDYYCYHHQLLITINY
jgi:hypothetical protein